MVVAVVVITILDQVVLETRLLQLLLKEVVAVVRIKPLGKVVAGEAQVHQDRLLQELLAVMAGLELRQAYLVHRLLIQAAVVVAVLTLALEARVVQVAAVLEQDQALLRLTG